MRHCVQTPIPHTQKKKKHEKQKLCAEEKRVGK
jgi:hypothetical protein